MRGIVAVLLAAGCEGVFGVLPINPTTTDAPPGVPPQCLPGMGWTFSVMPAGSSSYTVDAAHDRAAWMDSSGMVRYAQQAEVDDASAMGTQLPYLSLAAPRLSPEGDEIFVRDKTGSLAVMKLGSGAFEAPVPLILNFPTAQFVVPGTPTARGGGRRRMLLDNDDQSGGQTLVEIEEVSDSPPTWNAIGPFTLDVTPLTSMNLLPDGLTMVYTRMALGGPIEIVYNERPSRNDPWVIPATQIYPSPGGIPFEPFVSYDCRHLYATFNAAIYLYVAM